MLPTLTGHWILLLLRTGQHRLLIEPQRRRFIRQDVVRLLELRSPDHPVQTAHFSLQDVADMGAGIQTVLLVDDPPPPDAIAVTAQVRALDEAPDVEQLTLITLLEQSAYQPDSEAFFLAATPPETLSEVWAEGCRQAADDRRKLRLAEHLPAPSFDIAQDSVPLPHSTDVMRQVLSSWPVTWVFQHFCPALRLPASTQASLSNMQRWQDLLPLIATTKPVFRLFTDGSADTRRGISGFGVVILLQLGEAIALFGLLGAPLVGSPDTPWQHGTHLALHAEQIAIACAILWTLQIHVLLPAFDCEILFDCTAAGWAAEGSWEATDDTGRLTSRLEMIVRAVPGISLRFQHVPGHSDHPWNDLADQIAKTAAAARFSWPQPPWELCSLVQTADLSWVAVEADARVHHAMPILDGMFTWSATQLPPSTLQPEDLIPTVGEGSPSNSPVTSFRATFATINIQGLGGKVRYIEAQLDYAQINIAFMQETKTPAGVGQSGYYLRIQSGADKHWGTAIWIHRTRGLVELPEGPLLIDEHDIAVLCEQPRLLILLVTKGGRRFGLVSCHCPHTGRGAERNVFLEQLAAGLKRIKHADLLLGGIDLNGRLPTCYQGVTGDAEFQDSDETGWKAAAAFAEAGIWLPSMYSSLHCREHATYTHPSGTSHRIDYNLVGGRATVEAVRSEVDPAFDNGSPQDDHKLLRAQITGMIPLKWPPRRADTSSAALEDHVRTTLDAEFALPKKAHTAKYVPEEVWALRDAKQGLKCRTRHRATLWLDLAARAFFQWKTKEDHAVERLVQKQGLLYGVTALAIKLATRNIRRAINIAKDAFLQSVAREGHQGAAKVLQRVKLAGLGGAKAKPKCRPLPVLLHPVDQTVAATRSQRDAVWLHQLGQQEQGDVLSVSEYLGDSMLCRYDAGCEWQISMLPCYEDVTKVLRSAPKGKAAGLDCIPADALSASPNACARALLPLVLKSMLRQRQPAQWRGGVLFEAFKRSGLQSEVSNYRSLFVSNNLGKIYHRLVRNKAQEHCRDEFHGLHLGSKKRAPVAFASLYVLSCLRRCRSSKRSASILFLDTAAAYYRIIRELACGDIREDHTIRLLFHRFGLTEQDMLELLETIHAGGMLSQAGLPDALGKIVKDIHLHTWFVTRFSDGARVCSSLAGSRPGESWADLIFAHVYSRVLHQIQEHVVAAGLGCQLAFDSQAGLYGTQGDQLLDATDATWADDSAFYTAADTPTALLERTQRLCSLVVSFCEGHGMSPNLRPGKTALVFSLVGKGLAKAKRRFFGHGEQHLSLPDLAVSIPVAEYYKHLGGYIDGRLSMSQETRYRLAQATSSYESSKTLLLNNPGLSLATRAAIFASAVTPTFFNIGQWIPEGKAWKTLETGYSKLAVGG
eukprot:s1736_g22.t4